VANKLPVGIQIVGPYLEDRTTLELGRHLLAMGFACPRPAGF
jgi:Asp-tRNA(Asn)/Glu-tRNA(Gln) amidotransferase A subunit family amidase